MSCQDSIHTVSTCARSTVGSKRGESLPTRRSRTCSSWNSMDTSRRIRHPVAVGSDQACGAGSTAAMSRCCTVKRCEVSKTQVKDADMVSIRRLRPFAAEVSQLSRAERHPRDVVLRAAHSGLTTPVPAPPSALGVQPYVRDADALANGLAHVVHCEGRRGHRRQGLHLHAYARGECRHQDMVNAAVQTSPQLMLQWVPPSRPLVATC